MRTGRAAGRAGLHLVGELGVDRFVDERPAVALDVGDALQEVGVSAPRQRAGLVEERRLEDDVGTVGDGLPGQRRRRVAARRPCGTRGSRRSNDPRRAASRGSAARARTRAGAPTSSASSSRSWRGGRTFEVAERVRHREPVEVLALEVPDEVGALTTQRPSARYIARRSRNRRQSHASSCSEGVREPDRVG